MKIQRKLFIGQTGSGATTQCLNEAIRLQLDNNLEVILFSRDKKSIEKFNIKQTILIDENTYNTKQSLLKNIFDINIIFKTRKAKLMVFDNIEWLSAEMNNIYEYYKRAKSLNYSTFVSIQNIENIISDNDTIYKELYMRQRNLSEAITLNLSNATKIFNFPKINHSFHCPTQSSQNSELRDLAHKNRKESKPDEYK